MLIRAHVHADKALAALHCNELSCSQCQLHGCRQGCTVCHQTSHTAVEIWRCSTHCCPVTTARCHNIQLVGDSTCGQGRSTTPYTLTAQYLSQRNSQKNLGFETGGPNWVGRSRTPNENRPAGPSGLVLAMRVLEMPKGAYVV